MSKDTTSPNNYQLPSSEFLKVHEDEPAYKQFKIIDAIMQMSFQDITLYEKIILMYIIQLQGNGYCHAGNQWFAIQLGMAKPGNISGHITSLIEKGLVKKKNIIDRTNGQVLQRRLWLTARTIKILDSAYPEQGIPLPPKQGKIVPKGTETSIVPKRKKKYKPIKSSWKDI